MAEGGEDFHWQTIIRDWSRFQISSNNISVEARAINNGLVSSLVSEFQHYSLFDQYYGVITRAIIEGFTDEDREIIRRMGNVSREGPLEQGMAQRGRNIVNRTGRLFKSLRKILFPEARPFEATRGDNAKLFASNAIAPDARVIAREVRRPAVSNEGIAGGGPAPSQREESDSQENQFSLPMSQLSIDDVDHSIIASGAASSALRSHVDVEADDDIFEEYWSNNNDNNSIVSPKDTEQPIKCVLCQRADSDSASVATGGTIVGGGCGCTACMCRMCWRQFYQMMLTSARVEYIGCPVCGQNVLPYLRQQFPDVVYRSDVPEEVGNFWTAQIQGRAVEAGGNPRNGRACGLCNRVTEPTHTRRTCPFREARRQFVERTIQSMTEEYAELERVLERNKDRVVQAEEELQSAREEMEWNVIDMADSKRIVESLQRELDNTLRS